MEGPRIWRRDKSEIEQTFPIPGKPLTSIKIEIFLLNDSLPADGQRANNLRKML
jgi:hypothetical protein